MFHEVIAFNHALQVLSLLKCWAQGCPVVLIKKWISFSRFDSNWQQFNIFQICSIMYRYCACAAFFILGRMRERERELGCRNSGRMGVGCVGELLMRAASQRNPSGRG
jgi:hypothetical protein